MLSKNLTNIIINTPDIASPTDISELILQMDYSIYWKRKWAVEEDCGSLRPGLNLVFASFILTICECHTAAKLSPIWLFCPQMTHIWCFYNSVSSSNQTQDTSILNQTHIWGF